jgi:hypothetical protein
MKAFMVVGVAVALLAAGPADATTRARHARAAGAHSASATSSSRTSNLSSLDGGVGGGALAGMTLRTDVPKTGGLGGSDLSTGGKHGRGGGDVSSLGGAHGHKKSGGL